MRLPCDSCGKPTNGRVPRLDLVICRRCWRIWRLAWNPVWSGGETPHELPACEPAA